MSRKSLLNLNRRRFIRKLAAAVTLPLILPGCATKPVNRRIARRPTPSNRIQLGVIGWGLQGRGNTKSFLAEDDCQVVAACDLDKKHLASAVKTVNEYYRNQDCRAYQDYRELFDREDLDAVMIAVPDHWHELIATEAARRGLDVYGETPLAKTIAEQQAIVRAVQANDIIWQTGSWQRSQALFRKAAEIVRNGLIGQVTRVEVGLPAGYSDLAGNAPELLERLKPLGITALSQVVPNTDAWKLAVSEPPADLNYEMWIGPSHMEPYIKQRVHQNWRWNYDTGGGQLLAWAGHHLDIAHWGLGCDRSGPLEVEGYGEFPRADALWNTSPKYRIEMKYPEAVSVTIAGGFDDIQAGTKWIGTEGWVWVNRGGFDVSNPKWKSDKQLHEAARKTKLYSSPGHFRNFLDCVRSRKSTVASVQVAHHSTIPAHLGLISMRLNRPIHWNAATETIVGDPEASQWLTRAYRTPWKMS